MSDPGPAFGPLPPEPADDTRYLIWSNEHRAWWKPARRGYTKGLLGAGRYSRGDALDVCRNALPGASEHFGLAEIPVREDDLLDMLQGQRLRGFILRGE